MILEEERCKEGDDDFYTDRLIRIFILDENFPSLFPIINNLDDFVELIEDSMTEAQNILQRDDRKYRRRTANHGVSFYIFTFS